jgi:Ca-activated chloride channel family protein
MAKQIAEKSAVGSRQSAVRLHSAGRVFTACGLVSLFAIAVILGTPFSLEAESLASKNREGNRLFAQGKYEDAEKAYLDAQVKNPGRPEILYNLGNSLIKQNKHDQGIQSLRQSIDKGDTGAKKNSWYNTGNALFSMGRFKDSAEAFIQALRLDPADHDAKHNLELALKKLKQQQNQSNSNQKKQSSDGSDAEQASSGKDDGQPQPKQSSQNESGSGKEQNKLPKPQTPQEVQREGSMNKEQAAQILDAVRNQELEQQRKLLEHRARRKTNEKDW